MLIGPQPDSAESVAAGASPARTDSVYVDRARHGARPALCGWAGVALPADRARRAVVGSNGATADADSTRHAIAAAGERVDCASVGDDVVVIIGRPRWRDPTRVRSSVGVARELLDAYRREGEAALDRLGGSFALAIVVDGGRDALVAVDRMGIVPLAYALVDGGVVFGSSTDLVDACRGARSEIDVQSVFNYVFLHMVPGPCTVYRDQARIPAGGYVRVRDGVAQTGTYWKMRYDERERDIDELAREFRALLDAAVADLLDRRDVGTFLSGGTDSSTVAGVLTRLGGKPVRTYSIGFDAAGYDEMHYARIAARHFGTDHHEYYVTPADVLALAPRVAAYCDQPFGNASAVPTYWCAHVATSDGVELMLAGDGGDELFGGNARYATQAMLSWYERVPRPLRRRVIEPLLFALPAADRLRPLRWARSYVRQASTPPTERLHAYNMIRSNGAGEVFSRSFRARIDESLPLRLLQDEYDAAHAAGMLNRMLAVDLRFTLVDNDLYKVSTMCALAGVDVGYPMLDDRLVAFSAALPARLKLKGTRLRYFFKRALRDVLPREIITKRKHGFGLPIGEWMQRHAPLRDLLYDAVTALGSRGIVREEFIARMIAGHRSDNPAYWGAEIWVLAQLELWLQAHGRPRGERLA